MHKLLQTQESRAHVPIKSTPFNAQGRLLWKFHGDHTQLVHHGDIRAQHQLWHWRAERIVLEDYRPAERVCRGGGAPILLHAAVIHVLRPGGHLIGVAEDTEDGVSVIRCALPDGEHVRRDLVFRSFLNLGSHQTLEVWRVLLLVCVVLALQVLTEVARTRTDNGQRVAVAGATGRQNGVRREETAHQIHIRAVLPADPAVIALHRSVFLWCGVPLHLRRLDYDGIRQRRLEPNVDNWGRNESTSAIADARATGATYGARQRGAIIDLRVLPTEGFELHEGMPPSRGSTFLLINFGPAGSETSNDTWATTTTTA
mmetsp:Transcript_98523/g.211195  ORF Transcript_98523/g.211195 Transcript_98523/m.211195 type:complete len:314 (+) Transcript_98523:789-1730(+)